MKKAVMIFALTFLLFGMLLHSPLVLAKDNDSNSSNNTGTSGKTTITASVNDSDDVNDDVNDGNETDSDDKEDDGNKARERTETRIREKDGGVETEFKSEIRTADGERVKIERKIKIKNGEVEIKTKLKVEGKGSNFSIVDSDGERHRIRVTPEKLRMLILERLNASNITEFSLEEVEHKNIPRVVFKVNSDHPGRFLGVFRLAVIAETQIDPETGEILDVNTPWWVFLVVGEDIPDSDEIVGNETLEGEIVASDEELEEEFEDIEVDEELEINVKTFNNASEVKIELEFDTETSNTNDVISEILSKLTLSSEEIDSLLEMEDDDELLETEEKLKIKIESEDDLTEVEFELRFVVNSDNREAVISAIIERLSSLTVENLNSVLVLESENEKSTAKNAQKNIDDARAKNK